MVYSCESGFRMSCSHEMSSILEFSTIAPILDGVCNYTYCMSENVIFATVNLYNLVDIPSLVQIHDEPYKQQLYFLSTS